MKLQQIIEAEAVVLPRTETPHAEKLAKEFVDMAIRRYGKGDETYNPEVVAKKLASNFHKAMLQAIDEELKYRRIKRVSPYGEEGSFRATA